jgi:hypothetical protein
MGKNQDDYRRITLRIPPDLIPWVEGKEQMNAFIVEALRRVKKEEEAEDRYKQGYEDGYAAAKAAGNDERD